MFLDNNTIQPTDRISLKHLLSLDEWINHFNNLSSATGLALEIYDERNNLLLSAGENPACKVLGPSSNDGPGCAASCNVFITDSLGADKPLTGKCSSNVINLLLPITYLSERAVIVVRGGFTSYEDFLGFMKIAKNQGIRKIPLSVPLDFVDDAHIKRISKYIYSSINFLLNALQEKSILVEKISRLSGLVDSNILRGLSRNMEFVHRYIVDTIGFILNPVSITIFALSDDSSTYKTVCSSGKNMEPLSSIELNSDSPIIRQILASQEFPVEVKAEKLTTKSGTQGNILYFFPIFISGRIESLIGICNGSLLQEDKKIINTFCDYIEASLENHMLRDTIEGKLDGMLTSISDLSNSIVSELDREKLIQTILEKSAHILKAEQGSLMLLDSETSELLVEANKSIDAMVKEDMKGRKGKGISGKVLESGIPMLVEDVEKDPRINQKNKPRYRTKSFLSVPIKIDGRVEGVLNMTDKQSGEAFNENDLKLMQSVTSSAAVAIERSILYKRMGELQKLSFTDSLTGTLNRRYLNTRILEEIARFNRYKQNFSFLMIDIDGFKQYNDNYGHLAGDNVLKIISNSLRNALRNIDILARFGGDEFVIILPQTPKEDAISIARRLNENIAKTPIPSKNGSLHDYLSISIGLTSYPDDASSAEELLEKTDQALYLAKKGGKNRFVYL